MLAQALNVVTLAWGPEYYSEALKLKASAAVYGIPVRIVQLNGWPRDRRAAWALRPGMVLDLLDKCPEPVLMVDADARIEQDPRPLLGYAVGADLAAFQNRPGDWWACTVLWNQTPAARRVLLRWHELMKGYNWTMDSIELSRAIEEERATVHQLAPELVWWDALQHRFGTRLAVIRQLAIGTRGVA